uniref:Uncharacterized protein n=1 Tax=Candidatus Nitrotoga fabula TaxID=2182327 RepID=A0A2X0R658_9PROT|nr:protein of unknown function [Candidatus Nitrotoga fabula]
MICTPDPAFIVQHGWHGFPAGILQISCAGIDLHWYQNDSWGCFTYGIDPGMAFEKPPAWWQQAGLSGSMDRWQNSRLNVV